MLISRNGIIRAFAALALLAAPAFALSQECPAKPYATSLDSQFLANLGVLKRQLTNYRCFGQYDVEVEKALAEARAYLQRRIAQVQRPAIVLDIDETALSNMAAIAANDYGYIPAGACDSLPQGPCGWREWERSKRALAIKPTLAFFDFAKSKGVGVFFVTGRSESEHERSYTEANLQAAGYFNWDGAYFRPPNKYATVAAFKSAARAQIESKGFTIVANVGDQWSDLEGGFSERVFKVPNPFYYIP